jgi:hypothetical protein
MTPNKYHSSGRPYTAEELAARAYDSLPRMVVPGYSGAESIAERRLKPFDDRINEAKRNARSLGYKSLKQFHRALHRA